jgi:hypothetical protein
MIETNGNGRQWDGAYVVSLTSIVATLTISHTSPTAAVRPIPHSIRTRPNWNNNTPSYRSPNAYDILHAIPHAARRVHIVVFVWISPLRAEWATWLALATDSNSDPYSRHYQDVYIDGRIYLSRSLRRPPAPGIDQGWAINQRERLQVDCSRSRGKRRWRVGYQTRRSGIALVLHRAYRTTHVLTFRIAVEEAKRHRSLLLFFQHPPCRVEVNEGVMATVFVRHFESCTP